MNQGEERDITLSETSAQKIDRQTDEAIQEIDKQIAALTMPIMEERSEFVPGEIQGGKYKYRSGGYIRKRIETVSSEKMAIRHAKQIKDLLILKANIISKANRLKAEMSNPQNIGLKMRNQQADMEDEMERQQREMEDKTEEMENKMRQQQAEIQRREREIQHLQYQKRMSEHNQRMHQLWKDMGQ